MKKYIDCFAALDHADDGFRVAAEAFFYENVPVFQCSDPELEQMYYFRWWTFFKHIKKTASGYVITEFLPDVGWAGKYNSINMAAGIHIMEGRWLRNTRYIEDYLRFWYTGGGSLRSYTTWLEYAAWQYSMTREASALIGELLPHMAVNYACWEGAVGQFAGLRENGLFEAIDDREGTEMSISGNGYRPPINAAMIGNCLGLARLFPEGEERNAYLRKAAKLKRNLCRKLWNEKDSFFEVLHTDGAFAGVRELGGYTPWYFTDMPSRFDTAWRFLSDPAHFDAPYGYTYADRSHPAFRIAYEGHECQWNGPSWPLATSMTLTAMANLLQNHPRSSVLRPEDFCRGLKMYAHSQALETDGGRRPWIDENLNPFTGEWISRTLLYRRNDPGKDRGKDYNHSSFCDLIISGLVGLRVSEKGYTVRPLCRGSLDWFVLDGVIVGDKSLSIYWDKEKDRVQVREEE